MKRIWAMFLLCAAVAYGQGTQADDSLLAKACRMTQDYILVDTHIDAPTRLYRNAPDLSVENSRGQFDYVRARAGGLDVPFMSIYIPSTLEGLPGAGEMADSLIRLVEGLATDHPDKFAMVRSPADVRAGQNSGKILLAMGMENGAPINGDLGKIQYYYDRGIRYITLAHAKNNHICDASYDKTRTWNGLSPFGRRVVAEMNRVGIMIDVSHISDSSFYQVLALSRVPVIASHSSCRHFTPGFERNMSDDMIRLLASKKGVIQISFGSEFLNDSIRKDNEEREHAADEYAREHHLRPGDKEARAFGAAYRKNHPARFATVQMVADHIDHVVHLVGPDYVGIGSDFDGVGDSLPVGLKDASAYPNLIAELLKRGYTETMIKKVCGENLLRVWEAVEAAARR
jgi:membrane dipeptidase